MSEDTARNMWLGLEHELPAAETGNAQAGSPTGDDAPASVPDSHETTAQSEGDTAELRGQLARVQAEFENARKRSRKEQQDFREYALFDAAKTLLPIVDNFERALRTPQGESPSFRSGVELIYKQLMDALSKFGVRPIPAKGQRFDPTIHQAVNVVDTSVFEDQHIVEELQRGYMFKDRLLRPAMVTVARNQRGHNHRFSY